MFVTDLIKSYLNLGLNNLGNFCIISFGKYLKFVQHICSRKFFNLSDPFLTNMFLYLMSSINLSIVNDISSGSFILYI